MDPHAVDLGFVLRQFKNYNFSMKDFKDRLHLQKFVYLLQAHDIYLGYDYLWYIHGPYCTILAEHGFELDTIYNDIPETGTEFIWSYAQQRFEKFKEFIKDKENDVDFLDITATLHSFLLRGNSKEQAIEKIMHRKNINFTYEQCTKILETVVVQLLKNTGMINKTCFNDKESIIPMGNYKTEPTYLDKIIPDIFADTSEHIPEMYDYSVFRCDQIVMGVDMGIEPLSVDNAVHILLMTRD